MSDFLETDYIRKWAQKIVDAEGYEALRLLSQAELKAKVLVILGPLPVTPFELISLVMDIKFLVRKSAPPADSPRQRGAERMYR
jgi:hypothetical protein